MAIEAVDLFRMATLRAPQLATPRFDGTAVRDDGVEHSVDEAGMLAVHVIGDFTLKRIDEAWLEDQPKLISFNNWLSGRRDFAAPDEVNDWYSGATGAAVDEIVATAWFDETERVVHASLLHWLADKPTSSSAPLVSRARHDLLRATRLVGLLRILAGSGTQLKTARDVSQFMSNSAVIIPAWFSRPADRLARPPLIADLKVVKLARAEYDPGGIVYIENVMMGEKRTREVRRTEELESTQLYEDERATDTLDEVTTTAAAQLTQEVSRTLQEQEQLEVGANVSAQYGPYVKVDANAQYGRESARSEASRAAATFSNQVLKRATERVSERHLSRRSSRRLLRHEEMDGHAFENTTSESNVCGIYRSLETVQKSWIENYGCRLMLEFMIPEPAAFVRWVQQRPSASNATVRAEPVLPTLDGKPVDPTLIEESNYLSLIAQVRATGVEAPPPPSLVLGKTLTGAGDDDLFVVGDSSLSVPDGFQATTWSASIVTWGSGSPDGEVTMVSVGGGQAHVQGRNDGLARSVTGPLDLEQKSIIPIIMLGRGLINFSASVAITCARTAAALTQWRIKVFDAILMAWRKDHEDWLREKAAVESGTALEAISMLSQTPTSEANREIERRELRRGVLTFLTGEPLSTGVFAERAVKIDKDSGPIIDFTVALIEADWISFLEQSFEWPNMTWVHYPYYWADAERWATDAVSVESDPLWNAFLTAGVSRVVVPVRPGFESAVCLYLSTGIIWDGGDAPTPGDPTYLGVAEELAEKLGAEAPEIIDRRDLMPVRMPTSLVWLQPTSELNP